MRKKITAIIALAFIYSIAIAQTFDQQVLWGIKKNNTTSQKINSSISIYKPQKQFNDYWSSTNSTWVNSENYNITYTNDGKEAERIHMDTFMNQTSRDLLFYNGQNLLTEFVSQKWINSTWVNAYRRILDYNQFGLLAQETYHIWDTTTHQWKNSSRFITTYDSHKALILRTSEIYEDNMWKVQFGRQNIFIYDNDLPVIEIQVQYNPDSSRWDTSFRVLCTFNAGLVVEAITQLPDLQNEWFDVGRQQYQYDSTGLIQVETSFFNQAQQQWKKYQLFKDIKWFNWNGDITDGDNLKSHLHMLWDTTSMSYANNLRYEKVKTDNNGSYISTEEIFSNNIWVPGERITMNFNHDDTRTLFRRENNLNNQWNRYYEEKAECTYDSLSRLTERIDYTWNFVLNDTEKTFRTRYNDFLEFNTGIDRDKKSDALNIYPNPAREKTNIKFQASNESLISIDVYNITGQKVKTVVANEKINAGEHEYQINDLPSGIYLIKLNLDGQVEARKLIIH